jgi:hypothetical protein
MLMTPRVLRFALSALSALSAFNAPSALAQSGVLIGVAKPVGYETIWIVRDSLRPIRATIPDLLVPRADGWWRVGTVPICSTGGPKSQSMDVLWRARSDSIPVVSEICHEVPRGELPILVNSADSVVADSLKREPVRCSWSKIRVKFVSPEHIAVGETSGQTEECEPRGGAWYQTYYVSRFHGDSLLALGQFAGPRLDSLGRLSLAQAASALVKDEVCTTLVEDLVPPEAFGVGDQWYPSRLQGQWMPVLFNQIATGDCQLLPLVDVRLASALTGHDSLRPAWSVLAERVKGLQDALASPAGDLVIVRATDSLFVHVAAREQLGRRLAVVPFREHQIVMIQWATGSHVARWNQDIMAMVRRGVDSPKVVAPPKDP